MSEFVYIHRPKMRIDNRITERSTFHMMDDADSDMSQCGAVRVGEDGYIHVHKDRKLLLSMTCNNCLNKIIVTTKR